MSTPEFTPRDAPHDMNAQMMRVHEWVADQQRFWYQRPAPEAPNPSRQQIVAHVDDVFARYNPVATDTPVHQGTADRRVSWLDQRTRSSTSRPFELPLPLHQQLSADRGAAIGAPGGSPNGFPPSFTPIRQVPYPPRMSRMPRRQERQGPPSRKASRVPEYPWARRVPTFEPVTPGGNLTATSSLARSGAAAAVSSPLPQFSAPVRQREHYGLIDLHNQHHNRPAQCKHPDRVTAMVPIAFISSAPWSQGSPQSSQVSVDDDTLTRSTTSSHEEGQLMMSSPRMTLKLDLSTKPAAQQEGTTEVYPSLCLFCKGLHYTRYCPPENWDPVDWMMGEGPSAPMSDADQEYPSPSSILDDRKAQSPEPDSQGLRGDWGDSRSDNGQHAYGLDLGSTQSLSTVSQPRETPDPSAQAS